MKTLANVGIPRTEELKRGDCVTINITGTGEVLKGTIKRILQRHYESGDPFTELLVLVDDSKNVKRQKKF